MKVILYFLFVTSIQLQSVTIVNAQKNNDSLIKQYYTIVPDGDTAELPKPIDENNLCNSLKNIRINGNIFIDSTDGKSDLYVYTKFILTFCKNGKLSSAVPEDSKKITEDLEKSFAVVLMNSKWKYISKRKRNLYYFKCTVNIKGVLDVCITNLKNDAVYKICM